MGVKPYVTNGNRSAYRQKPSQKTDFGSPQKARGICDKIQSSLGELRLTGKAAGRFKPEEYIGYFEN
jgi:hypothetical protein